MNAHYEDVEFTLPLLERVRGWRLGVDTARGLIEPDEPLVEPGSSLQVRARSLLLYEARR